MAQIKPAGNEVLVEEKRTRVESSSGKANPGDTWTGPYTTQFPQGTKPESSQFMDWIEQISAEDWLAHRMELHVKRDNGDYIGKWYQGPFGYEELQKKAGGGEYQILAKVDGQLRFNVRVRIAGKAKDPFEVDAPDNGDRSDIRELLNFMREQNAAFMSELRAMRGGASAEQAIRDSVQLGSQVLGTAVPAVAAIVSRAADMNAHQPAPDPFREIQMQFMSAMISKMMNPSDPIETFAKMLTAVKAMGLDGGGNGGGGGLGEALVRAVPAATANLAQALRALADGKAAEVRALELMRTGQAPRQLPAAPTQRPAQPATAPVPTQAESQPANAPPAPPPASEPTPQSNYFAYIESRIVRVLLSDAPVEMAAEDVYNYLRVEAPEFIDQLVMAGEEGILGLFRTEQVLMQVPQNPRLTEFVKKFLEIATETKIPDMPPPSADASAQPSA